MYRFGWYEVADRIAFTASRLFDLTVIMVSRFAGRATNELWWRSRQSFARLGWVAKGVVIIVVVFIGARLFDSIGITGLSRQLVSVGWTLLSVGLTALVIRGIWRHFTGPSLPRHPGR